MKDLTHGRVTQIIARRIRGSESIPHFAARIEDRFHAFREKRARKRGLTPAVIAYTGYGAPGWVRVLVPGAARQARAATRRPVQEDPRLAQLHERARQRRHRHVEIGGIEQPGHAPTGAASSTRCSTADLPPGWHTITVRTDGLGAGRGAGLHRRPATSRFGVISDVDDTVMVTALPAPAAGGLEHVRARRARAPSRAGNGRAATSAWSRAHPGAPVIYLSTGAWNVAPTLTRFLSRHLYPAGPLLLTDWGPTHDRWFRSGREHKRTSLARLAAEFPGHPLAARRRRRPARRGASTASSPLRTRTTSPPIAIRQLSNGEAVLAGGRSSTPASGNTRAAERRKGNAAHWVYAHNGAGLARAPRRRRTALANSAPSQARRIG